MLSVFRGALLLRPEKSLIHLARPPFSSLALPLRSYRVNKRDFSFQRKSERDSLTRFAIQKNLFSSHLSGRRWESTERKITETEQVSKIVPPLEHEGEETKKLSEEQQKEGEKIGEKEEKEEKEVDEEDDQDEESRLQSQASAYPSDPAVVAPWLKSLNSLGKSAKVLEVVAEAEKNGRQRVLRAPAVQSEYIRALVTTGKWGEVSLNELFRVDRPDAPGAAPRQPLYVEMRQGWGGWMSSFLGIGLTAALIYFFFFRGGSFTDMMGGSSTMHVPVEKDIRTTFKDVKGGDEAKEELLDIVEFLKSPEKFSRLGAKLPKGVLLVGPPGCGKTLMARALAGEAGVPFFIASGSEFEEMLVGVGAKRVRTLFEKAKEVAPCIIFLDEIDAIGGRRDTPESRYSKMTLNQLLVELDGFSQNTGIIVMAATNLPEVLDPALTRPGRFDRQVLISLPDFKARKDIISLYLDDKGAPDVNLESLARSTPGFSGADLFNMVNSAAIEATKKHFTKITMEQLETAKENVVMGPERKSLSISPETKRLTAYHEAGHALVALKLNQHQIVKATLVPRGHALGMVSYLPRDELLTTKEAMLGAIDTAMGGRVAEELIFGPDKVTQGAGSDFQKATEIAHNMVTKYGMSQSLGKMAFDRRSMDSLSSETKRAIEKDVMQILDQSYNRSKNILNSNSKQLHLLANALLEYETLSLEEIKMVVEGKDIKTLMEKKREDEENLRVKAEEMYKEPLPLPKPEISDKQ